MNDQDLRDCFAMFAMLQISFGDKDGDYANGAEICYAVADAMLEARKPKEVGIRAVKRTRKSNDEKN